MCGRFAYFGDGFYGYESLALPEPPPFQSYNIAPSQNILTIRTSKETGLAECAKLHWGLVPFWSESATTKFPLINARAEGIETKPSFRSPIRHRRCLIPASGFYEWQHKDGGKQPFFIRPAHGEYFALAGIWEHWQNMEGDTLESCAIITTGANKLMQEIHDRMPVILAEDIWQSWLNPESELKTVLELLSSRADPLMDIYPVTSRVNNPRNNDPDCIVRAG